MVKVFWTVTLLACFAACGALLFRCTPAERQDAVAVKAFAYDLVAFCKPTDTVEFCLDKLVSLGATAIKLNPERDGG